MGMALSWEVCKWNARRSSSWWRCFARRSGCFCVFVGCEIPLCYALLANENTVLIHIRCWLPGFLWHVGFVLTCSDKTKGVGS